MNGQMIQDVLVIAGMFFLRIGLPLLIVMGVGYLIQRWLEPKAVQEQFEGMIRSVQERTATAAGQQPCWEVKNCSPEARAACAATQQPDIPCWLSRQIAGQPLPDGCTTCQVRTMATNALLSTSHNT
jgi:hypothetical protein